METYRCIAIGINRYQFLQPLNYAGANAQALHQFLREEEHLSPRQSLLLTDTSTEVEGQSTYPTRDNIFKWLGIDEFRSAECTPRSGSNAFEPGRGQKNQFPITILWFFFSGYGVTYRGEDYLIPIDGKVQALPNTGIAMRSLFEALKAQKAEKILVILDLNRPATEGRTIGQQAIALGKQMGIAVVLSSQADQSAQAMTLRYSLFTTALLEALRYYRRNLTLAKLEQYLRDRLPEFSTHHWRPVHPPVVISPSLEASNQPLLPSSQTTRLKWEGFVPKTKDKRDGEQGSQCVAEVSSVVATGESRGAEEQGKMGENLSVPCSLFPISDYQLPITHRKSKIQNGVTLTKLTQTPTFQTGVPLTLPKLESEEFLETDRAAHRKKDTGIERQREKEKITPVSTFNKQVLSDKSKSSISVLSQILRFKWFLLGGGVFLLALSIIKLFNVFQNSSLYVSLDSSKQSLSQSKTKQELLNRAKIQLRSHQASKFNQAIGAARKIDGKTPLYNQAKTDIARWSQIILDIAQGRAKIGDFTGAIAAAQLVPQDQNSLYQLVQQEVKRWEILAKQQQKNQVLIEAARALIKPTQASSYNQAITTLRQIPVNEPRYLEAQQLIQQWSQKIYFIASTRAARGKLRQAIETAKLVPQDTPAYQGADQAISQWKQLIGRGRRQRAEGRR